MKIITIKITLTDEQYAQLDREAEKLDYVAADYLEAAVRGELERCVDPIEGGYDTYSELE